MCSGAKEALGAFLPTDGLHGLHLHSSPAKDIQLSEAGIWAFLQIVVIQSVLC